MLFASTVSHYIDRQTLALLAPYLQLQYHWSNTDYANLVVAFRVAYSIGVDALRAADGRHRHSPRPYAERRLLLSCCDANLLSPGGSTVLRLFGSCWARGSQPIGRLLPRLFRSGFLNGSAGQLYRVLRQRLLGWRCDRTLPGPLD